MQHIWFYSILVCVFLLVILFYLMHNRSHYWDRYNNYKCLAALGTGLLLWPFIDHPFIFGVVFWGVFQDRWDVMIVRWFKDNFEMVELDEWLGLPKLMNKRAPQ